MSVGKTVCKIFGMFDKVDDIVYEPIKLICDVIRQPLNAANDTHSQKLKMKLQKFENDLEMERKEREMKLTVEERKLNEEINEMIRDNQLARSKEMIDLEKQYRLEMVEAAQKLAATLTNISTDAREKILSLYNEKKKEYLDLQDREKASMMATVKEMKEIFPDSTAEIAAVCVEQLKIIVKNSNEFSALLNRDMENVFAIIDENTRDMGGLAAKYFQPAAPNQPAIIQNIVDRLEVKQ